MFKGHRIDCGAIGQKEKEVLKEFKGIWIPYEVLVDKNLNDKEKTIFSMILSLSKENDCIMSNSYISKLLNICNVQASRIINSLKKKGYINIQIICKENSKEIAFRKIIPINRYVNTYKQISNNSVNRDVKDIIKNNEIYYNKSKHKLNRDYSDFDWNSLYANNLFVEKLSLIHISEPTRH